MAGGLLYDLSLRLSADVADFRKNIGLTSKDMKDVQKNSKETGKNMKGMLDGVSQSMGGLKGITGDMVQSMGGQFGQMSGMFSGMLGMAKAIIPAMGGIKAAIISTGIGAILIAITTAIAGLIAWMKRTDEGSDSMRKAFDVIKAVINVVAEKLGNIGSAIVKLFKGDFKGAAEDAKLAFTGWSDAMKEGLVVANKLNDAQDDLEDYNETVALKRAQIEERISVLQAKARNEEGTTATQRLQWTKELMKANQDLFNLNFSGKQKELEVLKQEMAISADNQDNRQKINEKEAELVKERTTYNQSLKETIKLTNKLADDAKAEEDALKKIQEYRTMAIPMKITVGDIKSPTVAPKLDKSGLKTMQEFTAPPPLTPWQEYTEGFSSLWETALRQTQTGFIELSKQGVNIGSILTGALTPAVDSLTSAFAGLFTDTEGGFKNVVTVALQAIGQIINALFAQAIAGVIAGESKKGLLGLALGAIGVGILTAMWQTKVPSFAQGGVVSSPTMALIGDAGKGNPEYVLPERKLKSLMGGVGGEVRFVLEGSQLIGLMKRENQKQIYF